MYDLAPAQKVQEGDAYTQRFATLTDESRAATARIAERDGVDAVLGPGPAACVSRTRARARYPSLPPSLPLRAASPSPARVV